MRPYILPLVLLAVACGSDDSEGDGAPKPPVCLSDAKLSGGVSVDDSEEFDCPEGAGFTKTTEHVTVESRLPGEQAGIVSVRIFGLKNDTSPGTSLPSGLALDLGVPPSEHWEAGWALGDACSATIEAQAAQKTEGELLVTANLTCSAPLISATAGTTPVTVERLRVRALYRP